MALHCHCRGGRHNLLHIPRHKNGIKIAKSDEQNSRENAKKDLIGAIVGFLIIFILMVALEIAMPILEEWVKSQIA